jgi:hypothetical protein
MAVSLCPYLFTPTHLRGVTHVICRTSDVIGSVNFHPLQPLLLSVSGSRNFPLQCNVSDSSSGDEEDDSDAGSPQRRVETAQRRRNLEPITLDASVKVWHFGGGGITSQVAATCDTDELCMA